MEVLRLGIKGLRGEGIKDATTLWVGPATLSLGKPRRASQGWQISGLRGYGVQGLRMRPTGGEILVWAGALTRGVISF